MSGKKQLMSKSKNYLVTLILEEVEQHGELQDAYKDLKKEYENRDNTVDELIADKVALQKSLEKLEKQLEDEKAKKHTYKAEHQEALDLLVEVEAECEEHKRTIHNSGIMFQRMCSGRHFGCPSD